MKKTLLNPMFVCLVFVLCLFGTSFAQDQALPTEAECSPFKAEAVTPNTALRTQAMWDVLFNYNMTLNASGGGYAAVCFVNNEYWVSKWNFDSVAILDASGMLIRTVSIPGTFGGSTTTGGTGGIRSFTYDGSYIYAGLNTTSIKKINPNSLAPTVAASITAPSAVRSLTYDATANAGAGGFWISNYNTAITQISMTGTVLNSITASSHGLVGMYGSAVDNYSVGGPYLWVFDQAAAGSVGISKCKIYQINIGTGLQTGVLHDPMTDVALGFTIDQTLAGGLYVNAPTPGVLTVMGLLQGVPTNQLFGYDLNVFVGLNDPAGTDKFLSVYPSVTDSYINIKLDKQNNNEAHIRILDATGRVVFDTPSRGINNYLNVSSYNNGVYFVQVEFENGSYSTRFVKN